MVKQSLAYDADRDRPGYRSGRDLAVLVPALLFLGWLSLLSVSCSREDSETATAQTASASISAVDREDLGSATPSRPGQSSPDAPTPELPPDPAAERTLRPDVSRTVTADTTGEAGRTPRPGVSPPQAVTADTTGEDTGGPPPDDGSSEPEVSASEDFELENPEPDNTAGGSSSSATGTPAPDDNVAPTRTAGTPESSQNTDTQNTGSRNTQNPGGVSAYRVEQVTEGVPDPRPGMPPRKELQALTVAKDGQRLVLDKFSLPSGEATPRLLERYILRLDRDPPVLWVEAPDGSWYEEHRGDLTKIQRERRIRELQILAKAKEYPRKEREAILRLNHLQPRGEREVTVEWGETRQLLGKECRRLIVKENGRVIIDSLVSENIAGGRGFFDLYSRLGAFSPEVLEKIRDVRGLPLAGSITVVTKLTAHPFRFEVKEFEEITVPAEVFARPGGEKREPQSNETRCAHCGKSGERERMEFLRFQGPKYFCDPECKRSYLEERFGKARVPERK